MRAATVRRSNWATSALQAIPKYIANDGWPDERPFVVLAPQHEDTGNPDDYSQCDAVEFPGSCGTTAQHDLGNPTPGSVCFTPDEVDAFLTFAVNAYNVDPKRVYLTGISCGAFGAWEYVAEHGDKRVAAARRRWPAAERDPPCRDG